VTKGVTARWDSRPVTNSAEAAHARGYAPTPARSRVRASAGSSRNERLPCNDFGLWLPLRCCQFFAAA